MLILTRRPDESLIIGNDVKVTILGIHGNQVRIGVTAPKNITVHREEVYQRIQEERNNKNNKSNNKECEGDAAVAKEGTFNV